MIRKDFIDTEIQKLTEVIAKIIGLKNLGNLDEALDISKKTLEESFGFDNTLLKEGSVEDFEVIVRSRNYQADKLNALAELLFEHAYPFQDTEECHAIIHKAALILNLLETEHKQQSFQNLSRRDMIDKFLNNDQYE